MSFHWQINWGDGSPVEQFAPTATAASHVCKDGTGVVTLDILITDEDGVHQIVRDLTVNDVPPVLRVTGTSTSSEGQDYTIGLSYSDVAADSLQKWTIDWGDGAPLETLWGAPNQATHGYTMSSPTPADPQHVRPRFAVARGEAKLHGRSVGERRAAVVRRQHVRQAVASKDPDRRRQVRVPCAVVEAMRPSLNNATEKSAGLLSAELAAAQRIVTGLATVVDEDVVSRLVGPIDALVRVIGRDLVRPVLQILEGLLQLTPKSFDRGLDGPAPAVRRRLILAHDFRHRLRIFHT